MKCMHNFTTNMSKKAPFEEVSTHHTSKSCHEAAVDDFGCDDAEESGAGIRRRTIAVRKKTLVMMKISTKCVFMTIMCTDQRRRSSREQIEITRNTEGVEDIQDSWGEVEHVEDDVHASIKVLVAGYYGGATSVMCHINIYCVFTQYDS